MIRGRTDAKRSMRVAGMLAAALLPSANLGCLWEQSFQLRPEQSRRVVGKPARGSPARSTRAWLRAAHRELAVLLPASSPDPLLTEELLSSNGTPIDVLAHFGVRRESLQSLLGNLEGMRCTAQAASQDYCIDRPAPPWPGFEDVWIPVDERFSLSGRRGYALEAGHLRQADCIVILPGLFGDNGVKRTRDLALFLRESGFHVLALEIRGHGQTEARYPEVCHTFGVLETDELMFVSDWLEQDPHIRRTGLIGYCWGANIALLAGWYEGRSPDDPSISPALRRMVRAVPGKRRFCAGIIAFSPILRWEELLDELDTPRSYLNEPIYASVQTTVRDRMERKDYPERSGSLRNLIEYDYLACAQSLPGGVTEGYPFLRLLPYDGDPSYDKLEHARGPILIVHAADDPLAPAQDVSDLVSTVHNPLVAAVILAGGGHVGFAAFCKEYYFSLIASFFDPAGGAAARIGDSAPATRPGTTTGTGS